MTFVCSANATPLLYRRVLGLQALRPADLRRSGSPWQRTLAVGPDAALSVDRLLLLYMEGRPLDGQGRLASPTVAAPRRKHRLTSASSETCVVGRRLPRGDRSGHWDTLFVSCETLAQLTVHSVLNL